MRCIFCVAQTGPDEPIEHIVPESLGNKTHVLRRGLVCGACNNYFASKVEKPFLELPSIVALRFHEAVPSKKRRVPPLKATVLPARASVEVHRDPDTGFMSVLVPTTHWDAVTTAGESRLYLPAATAVEPSRTVSRFVAKVAVEAMAQRLDDQRLDAFIQDEQLKAIREHARFGSTPDWPVSVRKIYRANAKWSDREISDYQIVHEFDFLCTDTHEIYFLLAIFGQEFCINVGGPSLEGWAAWLLKNEAASPLHHGKNAKVHTCTDEGS